MKLVVCSVAAAIALTFLGSAVADPATSPVTNEVGKVVLVKTVDGNSALSSPAATSAVAKVVESVVPSWARSVTPPATYDDAQAGAVATNVVREASGGIWDTQLEVWWTPRMENGCLTYYATTNVNQSVTE